MRVETPSVCVIIAAWNAESTIARAIASALIQPEVVEIVVVDDGSTDTTAATAREADDGTGRMRIVTLERNRGPAAARNVGLATGTAPYVALLDADDFFLPDRFATLFAVPDWDAVADNIAFVPSETLADFDAARIERFDAVPRPLTLAAFVDANISRRGRPRRELGFAKPVIRRAFLTGAALRYDETLRLGEDYALYATMLARGARFRTVRRCGYVAVERAGSLSGHHRTADLAALLAFDRMLAATPGLAPEERSALTRHRAQLTAKVAHRIFLDARRAAGLAQAVARIGMSALPSVAVSIARDKLGRGPARPPGIGYLL